MVFLEKPQRQLYLPSRALGSVGERDHGDKGTGQQEVSHLCSDQEVVDESL